ncbi:SDR family oxidoreductase [Myroides odoratimimus]|uniref:SDR family NAD(P)-dependent oxidoreductase n=1 Tax=Myroides odoratimimus TaxID=76832 RepID=UPI001040C231|nr:SDR family oxidoreductase [Myroides odoratimimus]MCA4791794.1 SDR family oxidoreductase [Myroides odoratimimus]MCA4805661.1 SDR family oxidoreductase [Myroides odoratimimus]MCA4819055.1 SDR family oxidoreductase [Myroides odoratimimus]MDM1059162.1 SDR family oxidoreductase [Myroides odoratimimus]MDM1091750.1 SDR family oxidoreductase [Myroides odoratimimus]
MKNVIVTGTSRGIGLECVQWLSKLGHNVLAVSRKISDKLIDLDNVTCLAVDITKEEDLQKVVDYVQDNWEHVDILINNAGAIVNKPFEEITQEDFQYVYNVNVFGAARLMQVTIPFMKVNSHVVSVSSMGGVQGVLKFGGLAAYSSSKGAITILSELLAEEYKDKGIFFNVVALGAVQTEMLEEAFPGYQAPLMPDEMAEYIVNFAIHGNRFFNGKVLQVSTTTP